MRIIFTFETINQVTDKTVVKKKLIFVTLVVIAAGISYLLGFGWLSQKPIQSSKSAGEAKSTNNGAWHANKIGSQAFQISLPCQNTIITPTKDTYGFLAGTSDPTGFNTVNCSTNQCTFMAYDAPVAYPADVEGQASWLRNQTKDYQDPVTTIHGATAIVTNATNPIHSAYILSRGDYYLLEADCASAEQQAANEYFSSFTPLTPR